MFKNVSLKINPNHVLLCLVSEDQSLVYKDAVFLSPHKFVGGVETPGLCKSLSVIHGAIVH